MFGLVTPNAVTSPGWNQIVECRSQSPRAAGDCHEGSAEQASILSRQASSGEGMRSLPYPTPNPRSDGNLADYHEVPT